MNNISIRLDDYTTSNKTILVNRYFDLINTKDGINEYECNLGYIKFNVKLNTHTGECDKSVINSRRELTSFNITIYGVISTTNRRVKSPIKKKRWGKK